MASAKPRAKAGKSMRWKEDPQKACDELQAHSSCLASFSLRWKELEAYLSSIQRSIEDRFRELESGERKESPAAAASPSAAAPQSSEKDVLVSLGEVPEVEPRPELKSLCVNMDGRGLLVFINDNRKDLPNIYKELNAAIRAAPDPATLVLDAMDGFYPSKPSRDDTFNGGLHANRRTCIGLLERLHSTSPEIKPSVRDRAKKLAAEWEVKMTLDPGENNLEGVAFLQLLASYGIVSDFVVDDLLDLLASISKKKEAIGLCRNLGLHGKMADLVQKLSSEGKQLEAVKFIFAFDFAEKCPPIPLLKAYIKESKKIAEGIRKRGNHSGKSQNAAISRELDAVRAVIKAIEEYKLESEYSSESLRKHVAQLEQQKAEQKHYATSATLTNSRARVEQQQANKRPRTSSTVATAVVTAPPLLPLPQTQSQPPLIERASYKASSWPYDLTGSIHLYDRTTSIHKGNLLDLGAERSPPRSFLYSDPPTGSGLYDRSGAYGCYPLSCHLPPQYSSSLYP